ncbi:TetR/AcrR family transcriptional regulator [Mucilaginibacter robiniae]|uniref:TetR/AcrR family transcriptional regulator n=1 Tax=Mucilaginibacter robiniae TaxID=2728022 RepID=A0A7L5E9T5_9SPHI|nr:TetR/AcrR family transcriptional regulator [Mucilaginibacter robiniae]QJD97136.1 TetR/AcrR family transcriptional regulator [Mucilaginibacter robiniae]
MEATEQKIVDTAIRIFNEDISANLETVAENAGVTRRTLHRYFKDRLQLMNACRSEMQAQCKIKIMAAYASSSDPLKQLEAVLYAGIDCGSKYVFLDKLYQREGIQQPAPDESSETLNEIKAKWFNVVALLQKRDLITNQLTPAWIYALFSSMVTTTINALQSGDIARNDIKKFAWFSFSKSIGVKE